MDCWDEQFINYQTWRQEEWGSPSLHSASSWHGASRLRPAHFFFKFDFARICSVFNMTRPAFCFSICFCEDFVFSFIWLGAPAHCLFDGSLSHFLSSIWLGLCFFAFFKDFFFFFNMTLKLVSVRDAKWCRTGLLTQATHQSDVTFNWSVIHLFPLGWKTGQFGAANE